MECPQCGLISPPGTDRCDCGYAFTADGLKSASPSPPQAARKVNWLPIMATVILSTIAFLWLFGPDTEPTTKKPESATSDLDRIFALRGQIVLAVQTRSCLPSPSSWDRVLSAAIDDEEATRAVVREVRAAGWPRTVLVRKGDQVKVLDGDTTLRSGTLARIRPVAHPWLDEGCWVPASTVLEKTTQR